MTHTSERSPSKLYRLWSIPLFLGGFAWLIEGSREGTLHLFGAGMVLMGIFAFRHNLCDLSPQALSASAIGKVDSAVMLCGVLLCLVSTVLVLMG